MSMTTANTALLRRNEIWSTNLKTILEDSLEARQYVNWLTEFPDGDTFTIPSIGESVVQSYVEDTGISYTALDTGEFQFTITDYVQSGNYITKKALQDAFYGQQLLNSFVPKQARAIEEYLETSILKLAGGSASGGQTFNNPNTINSADHRLIGTGGTATTAVSMAAKDFSRALYALKKGLVPDQNLIAIVDPSVEYSINNAANLISPFTTGNGTPVWGDLLPTGIGTGYRFVRNIFGFDVYVSNYLPNGGQFGGTTGAAGAETITGTGVGALTINLAGAPVCNIFMSAAGGDINPFVGAWRQMPEVDQKYEQNNQRWEFATTARWGLKVYRQENLVTVLTHKNVIV